MRDQTKGHGQLLTKAFNQVKERKFTFPFQFFLIFFFPNSTPECFTFKYFYVCLIFGGKSRLNKILIKLLFKQKKNLIFLFALKKFKYIQSKCIQHYTPPSQKKKKCVFSFSALLQRWNTTIVTLIHSKIQPWLQSHLQSQTYSDTSVHTQSCQIAQLTPSNPYTDAVAHFNRCWMTKMHRLVVLLQTHNCEQVQATEKPKFSPKYSPWRRFWCWPIAHLRTLLKLWYNIPKLSWDSSFGRF